MRKVGDEQTLAIDADIVRTSSQRVLLEGQQALCCQVLRALVVHTLFFRLPKHAMMEGLIVRTERFDQALLLGLWLDLGLDILLHVKLG